MQIDVVHHPASAVVFQVDDNGVTDAHPFERPWDFSVVGPIIVSRAVIETPGNFDGLKINGHDRWSATGKRAG